MKFARLATVAALAVTLNFGQTEAQEDLDIVDVAAGAGVFNTLVAAVQAAELVDVLKSDGPFTVFAPTDDAFAALPEGTVESLLLPENKDLLTSILLYHVVSGSVLAADVIQLDSAVTVNGASVSINVSDDGVTVDNADAMQTDVAAINGVIHIIDALLLPPAPTAVESNSWGEVKLQSR